MARQLYTNARPLFIQGEVYPVAQTAKLYLIRSTYAFDAAHLDIGDIDSADIAASATLTGHTYTDGVARFANPTFSAVPAGGAINAMIFTVNRGTDNLIFYDDTMLGLPYTSDGSDIILVFHADGLYKVP